MSIWKSPVFYFGIILLLVLIAALGAPFIVNWDSYRATLEDYGERLTGRVMTVDGPVSVRLFPAPSLDLEDVRFANGTGMIGEGSFASADRVTVRVSLAGLFSGNLKVEEIDITKPVLHLTRDKNGVGNWDLTSDSKPLPSRLLEQIKLDSITLREGTILLSDEKRGIAATVQEVSGNFSAPALAGPWRAKGAAQVAGLPFGYTFTSSPYRDDALRFGFKLVPEDKAFPAFSFDGESKKGAATGKMFLTSIIDEDGKQSLEGAFRPLNAQAEVEANFDGLALNAIKIQPADSDDSSTLIEGSALIDLQKGIAIDADLKSPRANVDAILGAQSLELWRVGGFAGFLDALIKGVPEKLSAKIDFNATVLTYAKETLENVVVSIEGDKDAIRVKRVATGLPGQSRLLFEGVIFPGEQGAELGGTLALEALDLRTLSAWVFPSRASAIQSYWKGSRGRLKGQSRFTLTKDWFGLQDLQYELDGAAGTGELIHNLGERQNLDIRLDAKSLNLDSYIKTGIALLPEQGAANWPAIISGLTGEAALERRIRISAAGMQLNGIRAKDVAIDVTAGPAGLDVRQFNVGSVSGAKVISKGQILQGANGPLGDVKMHVSAINPLGLVQFLGIAKGQRPPPWVSYLGATELDLQFFVSEGETEPRFGLVAEGQSGVFSIRGSSEIKNFSQRQFAELAVNVALNSPDGSALLAMLGVPVRAQQTGEGRLTVNGTGTFGGGIELSSSLAAAGAIGDFKGTVWLPEERGYRLAGNAQLTADNPSLLMRVIGVPVVHEGDDPLTLKAAVNGSPAGFDVAAINGTIAGQAVSGNVRVAPGGRATVNVDADHARLIDVLAAVLVDWNGKAATLDNVFADALPVGLTGEFWFRPKTLRLWGEAIGSETVIGVLAEPGSRRISLAGTSSDGELLSLEIGMKPISGQQELDISGKLPLSLADLFSGIESGTHLVGQGSIEGKVVGTGLTPFAVLADLTGDARLRATDVSFTKFAPQQFANALPAVKTAESLSKTIALLETGSGFALGNVDAPLTIKAGSVSLQPVTRTLDGATLEISGSADLPARSVGATARIKFDAASGLPDAAVVMSGLSGDVGLRSLTSDIAAKLGYEILARDLAELERVQKEQQAIIAREEQQRADDEVKFQQYQDQKAELRLRQREIRVHTAQRQRDKASEEAELAALLQLEPKFTNGELALRRREIETFQLLRLKAQQFQEQVPQGLPSGFNLNGLQPFSP